MTMKRILPLASLGFFLAATVAAVADTTFTYTVANNQATITGFATTATTSGELTVPATVDGYTVVGLARGAFKNRTGLTRVIFASGSSVTTLEPQVFQGCTGLTEVSLPASVTAVPAGAFLGCTGLTSVSLPSGLTSIEAAAFADCRGLGAISLPSGLVSLGESAFQNCTSLAALTIPAGVTTVAAHAFAGCSALTTVSLSSGLQSIGAGAFADAVQLSAVVVPDTVTTVGAGAFRGCTALTSLTFGAGVASIGEGVVADCSNLAALSVATGNTTFASVSGVLLDAARSAVVLAPEGLSGTYSVPSTVTKIGADAFAHCRLLTGVSLPSGLTEIQEGAFYYATKLASVTLPDSLTSIGAWAFGGCETLTTIVLPAKVASVGDDAFHHASALVSATFKGNAPTMGTTVFDGTASGFTIYYSSSATGFTTPTWLGYTTAAAPVITSATSATGTINASFSYQIVASGSPTSFGATGLPSGLSVASGTGLISGVPLQSGTFSVTISATNATGTGSAVLTLAVSSVSKITAGSGVEVLQNVVHPNGNIYDQVQLTGDTVTISADAGQVTRASFVDLTDDIVQVEFSGSGQVTITLSSATGLAKPVNYNQDVTYMRGHATISFTGTDATSNLSVFSVGKITAVNQALFKSDVTYDGIADIAVVSITSTDGKFGGLRTANASYFATSSMTGVYAPGVQFTGPVYVGDINAYDSATPVLVIGSGSDTRITGGDLLQTNGEAVEVDGLTQLKFVEGTTSHGVVLPAQTNKAVLEKNGVNVTSSIVVNPGS